MSKVDTLKTKLDGGTGGISIDSEGNIYIADFGAILSDNKTMGTKIFKITPNGDTMVFVDGLSGASGNEFDSHGNMYQSNIRGNYISKITPEGQVSTFVSEGITAPVGIAIDKEDNLFVANCGNNSIQKITSQGRSSRFIESNLLNCPNGLAFDEVENLYVANFDNGDILKLTPSASISRLTTVPGNNNGHLIYHAGYLFVVARSAHQIYRVSLDGEVVVFAGSGQKGQKDGDLSEASFCFPNDIEVSNDGKYFYINEVADVTTEGKILSPMALRRIEIGD